MSDQIKIAVIGLGYVGLPLAVEFGKKYETIGFDINQNRVDELSQGVDRTREVDEHQLKSAVQLKLTSDLDVIRSATIYIVTVPTPIDDHKQPDLSPLIAASKTVGSCLKKDDIVIYESTVFPGCTEEKCVPVLEKESGLTFNSDFFCGYSPERINPGDKVHTLTSIVKVTSGSTKEVAEKVNDLYRSIVSAGTHMAPSIKVAEAAKVIENSQRDINIAFMNELAIIFNRLGINTQDVLDAARTKWNFLPFEPGLVGGHCIGVDPYYLTYKAQETRYHPEIILVGRRLNDNMGAYVAGEVVKQMIQNNHKVLNSRVLVLGITFKQNCPDIRNSKVIDVIRECQSYGCNVDVFDPWANENEVNQEYGLSLIDQVQDKYDAIIAAVSHNKFKELNPQDHIQPNGVIYDLKNIFGKSYPGL